MSQTCAERFVPFKGKGFYSNFSEGFRNGKDIMTEFGWISGEAC
jgi:hypothetical protein